MRTPPQTTRRLCCAVDARNYSSLTTADQFELQADLAELLDAAAAAAHLERLAWSRQDGGDGELALLPSSQSETALIDDFVRELDIALQRLNRMRLPESRLRLRLAIHFGVASEAAIGYAGPAAVVVSRLLNSRPLKRALEDAPQADLVLGLSDTVYQDSVIGGLTKTLPGAFEQCRIDDEKYRGLIWIRTLERQGANGASRTGAASPKAPPSARDAGNRGGSQYVQNVFNGAVEAGVIGFNHGGDGS